MHNDVLYALEYILIFVLIGACDLLNYMGMDFMDVSYTDGVCVSVITHLCWVIIINLLELGFGLHVIMHNL